MKTDTFIILFVCSGNSCRSPMAEGLMRIKVPEKYRDQVVVQSAGTLGIDGNAATHFAIQVARELGADISRHRSQGVSEELLSNADIIFAMAREHKYYLENEFPAIRENIFLLKTFGRPSDETPLDSIDDPIGGSLSVYRQCAEIIDAELNRVLPRLTKLIEQKLESGSDAV